MSSWRSSSMRRPERTIPWSSAISTRTGSAPVPVGITLLYRHVEPNPCADAWTRGHVELAADEQGTLAHAREPEPAGGLVEGEAAAVVGDDERDPARAAGQVDPDVARVGVTDGVRERLLGDPVDDGLHVAGQA